MRKQVFSVLLSLSMVVAMLPGTAFAKNSEEGTSEALTQEATTEEIFREECTGEEITTEEKNTEEINTENIISEKSLIYEPVLLQNAVGMRVEEPTLLGATPESAFTFDSSTGTITGLVDTSLTDIVIPDTIGGGSVKAIGENAFVGCSGLRSVSIPNSVTTIGDSAFVGCSGLRSVSIPNSVTTIEPGTFANCSGLTSVSIPNSVTTIGDIAFMGCSGLTSVSIPNSVTSIRFGAFMGCSGLTSVSISNSVTTIGEQAFIGCSGLTSVSIPNSVTTIEDDAFNGCSGLTSVSIPNSVTTIEDDAFNGCSGLRSVSIPNSVATIGKGVFADCSGLMSVSIPGSVTILKEGLFYNCSSLTSVTIPNSVTTIGDGAFQGCTSLNHVYYLGTQSEYNNITIDSYNTALIGTVQCVSLSYAPPSDLAYNGTPKEAVVTKSSAVSGNMTVKYYQGDTEVSPVNAGTYDVLVTIDGIVSQYKVGAFTIAKGTPVVDDFVFTTPGNLTCDGSAKEVTIVAKTGISGMGAVTVKYYDENGSLLTFAPTEAGTYSVKIDVAEGTNYTELRNLAGAGWKFTLTKAAQTTENTQATETTENTKTSEEAENKAVEGANTTVISNGNASKTGDNTPVGAMLVLFLVSGGWIAVTGIYRRKKNSNITFR